MALPAKESNLAICLKNFPYVYTIDTVILLPDILSKEVIWRLYKWLFKKLIPIIYKLFQKLKEEGILSNSLYEALIPKPNKGITLKNKNKKERPLPLMIISTKILNKILTNQIQQHIKIIIYQKQVGLVAGNRKLRLFYHSSIN